MPDDSDHDCDHACGPCLRRAWVLDRLGGHLDRVRPRALELLALGDEELIAAVAGADREAVAEEHARFDPLRVRQRAGAAGLRSLCLHRADHPAALRELPAPPAALFIAGAPEHLRAMLAQSPVAIVGTRRPSPYGTGVARGLARDLAAAGVPVISGLALGIDGAAHAGALEGAAGTIAVLAGGAERPYPAAHRALHARIRARGAVVSELPPGATARRWGFLARNRIIAALAAMTVVVEAAPRSGALVTARQAAGLGRPVGAVPGRVTSRTAQGPNALIADGASVVRDARDALDAVFGPGGRAVPPPARDPADPRHTPLLTALRDGLGAEEAVARAGLDPSAGLAALAALELAGHVVREPGGRFAVRP